MGRGEGRGIRLRLATLRSLVIPLITACTNDIWNAGDLAEWVRDQAVVQGCERDSIELEDWYRSESGSNNWHGQCLKQDGAGQLDFAVNVDSVWTPSSSEQA